jgi:5-methylcytosine-specific restriction protein B
MTKHELGKILNDMYNSAKNGEKVAMIHLFGMKYGNKVKEISSFREIVDIAGIQESYSTEISKGSKISDVSKSLKFTTKSSVGNMSKSINIKNIILYGAPGIGKTHNYRNIIAMIEDGKSQTEIFKSISENEKIDLDNDTFELIKEEKRVEFVTFHQNYSYEDFIEGFRPNEDGGIELKDGIFKKLSDDSKQNIVKSNGSTILFVEALNLFLKEKIENQEKIEIKLKRNNSYYKIYDYNDKTIYFEKQNGDKSHTLSLKTLSMMYDNEVNNIINGGLAPYYNPLLQKLLELKNNATIQSVKKKNFYLVIDEINRGNISKIFGELITLIEEDKRDIYEVTLPYSKEKFSVPSNLYIIATMNSTDKSIATIDIALRRRFTFLKMKPNVDLVPKIAKELFNELNKFIESVLGEDYKLGHSYFMKVESQEDLEFVKKYKIKPLLEEYFYADDKNYDEVLKRLEINEEDR